MGKKVLKSRKRKEQTIAIIIVAAVVLIVTAAILIFAASKNENVGGHDHDHEDVVNLTVSLGSGEGNLHYASVENFKKEVEERTEGHVTVTIHGNKELGTGASVLETMEKGEGVADIVVTSVADFVLQEPRMDISALPFLFDSYEEASHFMESDVQKNIEAELVKKNIRVLAHYSDGFTHISSNQVVSTSDDMAGLSITGKDDKFTDATIKCFNAKSVLTTEEGVFQKIIGKQANAYMGSLNSMFQYRIYQEQRYLSMTYHRYEALAFAISENTWKKLSEEQKEIVQSAALKSAKIDVQNMKQNDETLIQRMTSAGVHVIYPKLESFTERAAAVVRGYHQKYGSYTEVLINEYMKK